MIFSEVNWEAVRRAAESDGVALVPLGSLEAHGPHLPCGTDTFEINEIVRRAVEKAGEPARVVVYPTIEYTITEWASPFASASLSPRTLTDTLEQIGRAAHELGFRKIVYAQGHANLPAVMVAVCQLRYDGLYAMYVDAQPYVMAAKEVGALTGRTGIRHAGVAETAMLLALRPDLVHADRIVDGPDDLWGDNFPYPSITGRPGAFCMPTIEALPDGHEGAATQATAEMGEQIFDLYASAVAQVLVELLANPVPEEYTRPFTKPLD